MNLLLPSVSYMIQNTWLFLKKHLTLEKNLRKHSISIPRIYMIFLFLTAIPIRNYLRLKQTFIFKLKTS